MSRIREYRQRLGMTQMQLSKALNISQATLSSYETGRFEPDMATMQRMADVFHASLDDIFGTDPVLQPASISDLDFQLSGELRNLTDIEKQDVLDYVRFKRAQRFRV